MIQLKLAVIAVFAFLTFGNVNAQDENNPWAIGFGSNVVDYFQPDTNFGDDFKDQAFRLEKTSS